MGAGSRTDRLHWRLVAAVALANLVVKASLAVILSNRGFFDQYDVLFDADPNIYLNRFTHDGYQSHALVHPTVPFLIGLAVRAISFMTSWLPWSDASLPAIRSAYAVLVAPLASSAQLVILAGILHHLGCSRRASLIMQALLASCFGGLVWGSTPESYMLSGLGIAALSFLAIERTRISSTLRTVAWTVVAVFVTGTTITNAIMVAAALALRLLVIQPPATMRAWLAAGAVVVSTTGLSVVGAFAASQLLIRHQHTAVGTTIRPSQTARRYGGFVGNLASVGRSAARLAVSVPNGLIPHPLAQAPIHRARSKAARYKMMFTFNTGLRPGDLPYYLSTVLVLCAGAFGYVVAGDSASRRHLVIWAALAFAGAGLHLLFGRELFLYLQHWLLFAVLILAGLVVGRKPHPLGEVLLGSFTLAAAAVSVHRLSQVLATAH